jgi:hypothetical protein
MPSLTNFWLPSFIALCLSLFDLPWWHVQHRHHVNLLDYLNNFMWIILQSVQYKCWTSVLETHSSLCKVYVMCHSVAKVSKTCWTSWPSLTITAHMQYLSAVYIDSSGICFLFMVLVLDVTVNEQTGLAAKLLWTVEN